MDIITYIQQQIEGVYHLLDAAVEATTDEQLNWLPPGTLNPISAILIHLLVAEDYFIQTVIQGQHAVWRSQDWRSKVGIQKTPGQGRSWEEFKTVKIAVATVLAYQQAVRAATQAYLAHLSPEELDRKVEFAGNERSVASMLILLVTHSSGHAGEIAAIKGMQGAQGLPY